MNEAQEKVVRNEKPVMEFLAVQNPINKEWAIPEVGLAYVINPLEVGPQTFSI